MADRQAVSDAPANVVVVATDGERLEQYESALRRARIQTRATLDADEAESLVADLSPNVLVLDRGLPRLVLFRLYGLVREDAGGAPVQIVFVGQEGETGPDDHYLPGEPSPTTVAERVTQLLSRAASASPTVQAVDTVPEPATAAPRESTAAAREEPVVPVPRVTPPAADVVPESAEAEPALASSAAVSPVRDPAPSAVPPDETVAEGSEAAVADAPKRSGRRLDVILIRVGLVLLILGALLILIQSDAFPPALTAPSAPAAPTRRPTASPKPGAFLDDAGVRLSAVVGQS